MNPPGSPHPYRVVLFREPDHFFPVHPGYDGPHFFPQRTDCTDVTLANYPHCRVCASKTLTHADVQGFDCCWNNTRGINPKHDPAGSYRRTDQDPLALISHPLDPLPPSASLSPALSSQAARFAQFYIAHALDGDLQAEYAAVVEAGDTVVTRDGSILSQRSCDGCTRNLLSVSRLCVHCGYELCPHCYHTLMEDPDAFPPERKLATPRAEMTRTAGDPLACQLLGTDAYSTHSPLAFATTTQISADDLGYLCGSANFAQQAYRVTALREALNIQQFVGELPGLNKSPARARATGSKLETDPYDTLEVADPSQVQEVMDKVMSLGQADRSRCLKPVLFRTDSEQKRWTSQHIVDAFKEGARLPARVQRRGEDAIPSELTPRGLMDALTGKGPYTWVDVRDYPLDADLAEVAPALDEAFRRAVGWPGEAYFPGCGEVSRLAPDISFRDAKAKLYASSATAEDVTTQAHVDEAMAINLCAWTDEKGADPDAIGAVWTILPREHFQTVVKFYHTFYGKATLVHHPIFRQSLSLSDEFLNALRETHGIRPWIIHQRAGEAVLVPQGAIHQVRNVSACFKIAVDVFPISHAHEVVQLSHLRASETCRRGPLEVHLVGRDGLALFPTLTDAFHRLLAVDPVSLPVAVDPHRIGAIQAADRQLAQARRSEILTLRSKVDLLEHQLSSLSRTGSAPGPSTASVAPTPPSRHLTEEMRAEVAEIIRITAAHDLHARYLNVLSQGPST